MAHDPKLKLELRLTPADGPADPALLDDLVRLVRQAVATAPLDVPQVAAGPGFREPSAEEARELRELQSRIEHRVQAASAESQAAVDARAEKAKQPDAAPQLADDARRAAELVIAAVQRALLRGVVVRVPEADA